MSIRLRILKLGKVVRVIQPLINGWSARGSPYAYSRGFLVRPLRGRVEEENQGAPLKPRQGPRPWTLLSKNLSLKARPGDGQRRFGSSVSSGKRRLLLFLGHAFFPFEREISYGVGKLQR